MVCRGSRRGCNGGLAVIAPGSVSPSTSSPYIDREAADEVPSISRGKPSYSEENPVPEVAKVSPRPRSRETSSPASRSDGYGDDARRRYAAELITAKPPLTASSRSPAKPSRCKPHAGTPGDPAPPLAKENGTLGVSRGRPGGYLTSRFDWAVILRRLELRNGTVFIVDPPHSPNRTSPGDCAGRSTTIGSASTTSPSHLRFR